MSFQQIAIIGAGQIGTSVAMAAALKYPDMEIVCYDTDPLLGEAFFSKAA